MDNSLIVKLAIARRDRQSIKDAMNMMLSAVTQSPEYKELETSLQQTMQVELETISLVNDAAFAEFELEGDKNVHEAVTIKEFHRFEIVDYNKALAWCVQNYTPGLSVDDKALIDLAKKGRAPEELVTSHSDFKATISQDLSKWLPT
jgi:hypothetical protein